MTHKVTTSIERITPKIAAKLLAANPHNRTIKEPKVRGIARDLEAGNWQLNGETLQIAFDGQLLNGQHRLTACIRTGITFETVVVRGLDHDVRRTIDSGVARSFGDRLQMDGIPNANATAASLRLVHAIGHQTKGRIIALTESELDRLFGLHPDILDSVHATRSLPHGFASVAGAIHYIGSSLGHDELADDYVSVLKTGIPLYDGCPVQLTRERILSAMGTRRDFSVPAKRLALVNAWNLLASGKSVRAIRIPEKFRIPNWNVKRLGL